ncbi:hypothetical protein JCM5353_004536 [Sporobolomyces roseus]
MPMPSLPIEIVVEIVSHLRAPPQGDTKEPIEYGRALSLVCRRWCPIGQALRWRQIQIDFHAVPSLVAHFAVHPKLGSLVSSFTHSIKGDVSDREQETCARQIADLADLLKVMVALVKLEVVCSKGSDPMAILLVTSRLPRLRFMDLTFRNGVVWSTQLAAIFAAGFPSLLEWSLSTRNLRVEDVESSLVTNTNLLKGLHSLSLRWYSHFLTSSLVQSFTASIDTVTLKLCDLWGSPVNSTTLQWLSSCPQLTDLTLSPTPETFADVYSDLLSRLPNMSSLEYLSIEPCKTSTTVSLHLLSSVLATIPTNLEHIEIRCTVFADWQAFEGRPVPRTKLGSMIGGLVEDSAGKRPAAIWQGEKGSKWYRVPGVWDTWDEFDDEFDYGQSLPLVVSLAPAHL